MDANINDLQKAFALAHKASNDPEITVRARNYFRAIEHLIWRSCESEKAAEVVKRSADLSGFAHLDR